MNNKKLNERPDGKKLETSKKEPELLLGFLKQVEKTTINELKSNEKAEIETLKQRLDEMENENEKKQDEFKLQIQKQEVLQLELLKKQENLERKRKENEDLQSKYRKIEDINKKKENELLMQISEKDKELELKRKENDTIKGLIMSPVPNIDNESSIPDMVLFESPIIHTFQGVRKSQIYNIDLLIENRNGILLKFPLKFLKRNQNKKKKPLKEISCQFPQKEEMQLDLLLKFQNGFIKTPEEVIAIIAPKDSPEIFFPPTISPSLFIQVISSPAHIIRSIKKKENIFLLTLIFPSITKLPLVFEFQFRKNKEILAEKTLTVRGKRKIEQSIEKIPHFRKNELMLRQPPVISYLNQEQNFSKIMKRYSHLLLETNPISEEFLGETLALWLLNSIPFTLVMTGTNWVGSSKSWIIGPQALKIEIIDLIWSMKNDFPVLITKSGQIDIDQLPSSGYIPNNFFEIIISYENPDTLKICLGAGDIILEGYKNPAYPNSKIPKIESPLFSDLYTPSPNDVTNWDPQQVATWIKSIIPMKDYSSNIIKHDIYGSLLKILNRKEWEEIGIIPLGHFKMIEMGLQNLL